MSFLNKYSLSVQLTIIFLLIFTLVITTFGFYDYKQQVKNIKKTQFDSMQAISESLSITISEDIYTSDYVSLEQTLLSLNGIDNIDKIRVISHEGAILSELIRDDKYNLIPTYNYGLTKHLSPNKLSGFNADESMMIREPIIFSGNTIAWIEVDTDNSKLLKAKKDIISELILLCGVILIVTLITIIFFLKLRLRSLQKLIEFSSSLPMAHGASVNIKNAPHEFQLLMHSLNWASKEIEEQHNELISKNQHLEERVTERTRELENAKNIAEKANQAKSDFLSRMSHELRTPMNAVLGFSQLLQLDDNIDKQHLRHVDEIMTAGTVLLKLINELLDLSTIEAGKVSIFTNDILMSDVVKQTLSLVTPIADQHDVSIEPIEFGCTDIYVQADPERMAEVLLNLVSNAIKYNKTNGKVWLSCDQDTDYLYLHVHDNGVGLSAEQIDVIFEPFNRAGAETSSVSGTGIGLSISQKLMTLMKGDIMVESQTDSGTRFTIKVPLSTKE